MRLTLALCTTLAALTLASGAGATPPPDKPRPGCDSRWCEKVRTTRAIAIRLDRVFARYGAQQQTGVWYARSGRRYNVSPFLVAIASAIESTFGQATCAPHNAWGLLAYCGSGFVSWRAGIAEATRYFWRLGAHRGRSVYSMGADYCPPCGSRWGARAESWQRSIFRVAPTVTYEQAARVAR